MLLLIAWLRDADNYEAAVASALRDFGPRAVPALIQELSTYPTLREREAVLLGYLGGSEALDFLVTALQSGNAAVSHSAAQGIAVLSDVAVKPLSTLLESSDISTRERAASALGRMRYSEAPPSLIAVASGAGASDQRAALEALGAFSDNRPLAALASALRRPDRESRRLAALALSRRLNADSVQLLALAARDEDWRVRIEALRGLGGATDREASTAAHAAIPGLTDEHFRVAIQARAALVNLGKSAVKPVEEALSNAAAPVSRLLQPLLIEVRRGGVPLGKRRDAVLGSDAPLIRERLSSRGSPVTVADHVQFSVTAPSMILAGSSFVLNVWAYLEDLRQRVMNLAKETHGTGEIRVQSKGPVRVERGVTLSIRLELPGADVVAADDTIYWDGDISNATFAVIVPATSRGRFPGGLWYWLPALGSRVSISFWKSVRRPTPWMT